MPGLPFTLKCQQEQTDFWCKLFFAACTNLACTTGQVSDGVLLVQTSHTVTLNHELDFIVKPRDGPTGCAAYMSGMYHIQEWMFPECFLEETVCEDWVPSFSIFMDQRLSRVLYISRKTECVLGPGVETEVSPHFRPWHIAGTRDGVCFHLSLVRFHLEEKSARTCQRRSMKWVLQWSLRSPSPHLTSQESPWECQPPGPYLQVSLKCRCVLISGQPTSGDECGLRMAGVMRAGRACLLHLLFLSHH